MIMMNYASTTSLIPIAVSMANTNACTTATNNDWRYKIIGNHIGKLNPINPTNAQPNPIKTILSKIEPDDIFPNNLMDNEIIFEITPTISKNHTNNEIPISPILDPIHVPAISHLPVIGTYSWRNHPIPRFLI